MKKLFSILTLASLLVIPAVALGNPFNPATVPNNAPELLETGDEVMDLIDTIGDWVFSILLAIASIFLIWAGFMYVTAAGNEDTLRKSRGMLVNALIGVAIALGAKGLVAVIQNILGAPKA